MLLVCFNTYFAEKTAESHVNIKQKFKRLWHYADVAMTSMHNITTGLGLVSQAGGVLIKKQTIGVGSVS